MASASSSSSSSAPSGVVEALERLVLSHPIVGQLLAKVDEKKTTGELLAGMPADAQQSLMDGILEMEKEDEEEQKTVVGQLSTFMVATTPHSPRFTHIPGHGPAIVVRIDDTAGQHTLILLKIEVVISHLCKQLGAGVRQARAAANAEVCPIDYLPTPADPFRVFESNDVDCSMRQQPYYSGVHDDDPPSHPNKRGRRSTEGGLVFVRDSYNAMQLCSRCVESVITKQPLSGNLLHTRGVGQLNQLKHAIPQYAFTRKGSQGKD